MSKIRKSQLWMKYSSDDIWKLAEMLPSKYEVNSKGPYLNYLLSKGPYAELPLIFWRWVRESYSNINIKNELVRVLYEISLEDLPLEINSNIKLLCIFMQWRYKVGK